MPRLSFKLGFRSIEMNSLDLPIEVRKPSSALVARTRSSQTIELPSGSYYVTARLPAGQEITRPVDLTGDRIDFLLEPDPEDRWDHEWDEERHFLDPPRPAAKAVNVTSWSYRITVQTQEVVFLADLVPAALRDAAIRAVFPGAAFGTHAGTAIEPVRVYLRTVTGNLLLGRHQEGPAVVLQPEQHDPGRIVYLRVQSTTPILVQHLEAGVSALNLLVPPRARLAVSRRPPATWSRGESLFKMEAFTESSSANLLLRYCRQGAYQRAGDAAESEHLLAAKIADPVAGAIGAYSLLRIGALERLHDWTETLRTSYPWLPDGAAIRGEHLARLGRHEDALAAFAELPTRGLPVLADGLFYAFDRARFYSRLKSERARGVDVERARAVREALEPYARVAHRQRPLTSFPGLDPARPDARRLREGERVPGARELHGLAEPADATAT